MRRDGTGGMLPIRRVPVPEHAHSNILQFIDIYARSHAIFAIDEIPPPR